MIFFKLNIFRTIHELSILLILTKRTAIIAPEFWKTLTCVLYVTNTAVSLNTHVMYIYIYIY